MTLRRYAPETRAKSFPALLDFDATKRANLFHSHMGLRQRFIPFFSSRSLWWYVFDTFSAFHFESIASAVCWCCTQCFPILLAIYFIILTIFTRESTLFLSFREHKIQFCKNSPHVSHTRLCQKLLGAFLRRWSGFNYPTLHFKNYPKVIFFPFCNTTSANVFTFKHTPSNFRFFDCNI